MATANIYCAPSDLENILSGNGVALRSDDAPPSAYGGAAAWAGARIDLFCWKRYDPSQLAISPLVTNWAAVIACFYLCSRRGNPCPQGISAMYEEAKEELKQIQKAINDIPGIGVRSTNAPGLSKMAVIMRPYPRTVVENSQSTFLSGVAVNAHQHVSAWDEFGFNNNLNQIF